MLAGIYTLLQAGEMEMSVDVCLWDENPKILPVKCLREFWELQSKHTNVHPTSLIFFDGLPSRQAWHWPASKIR